MALKLPSLYQLKKAILYPRKVFMRHRENLEPGFMRSAMELHYYRPAFYRWCGAVNTNSLLLYEADIDSNSIVIDAGYNPTIHAFEPDPRNYKQLQKKADTDSRLISYEFGLGDKNETVRMTLEFLGSTIYSDSSDRREAPSTEVKIKDIADTWKSQGFGHVDLMKINIEGAEFPLLERMIEVGLLANVGCFMIQFHEWHPGAYRRRRKIRKALSETHELDWDYHFVWEKWTLK